GARGLRADRGPPGDARGPVLRPARGVLGPAREAARRRIPPPAARLLRGPLRGGVPGLPIRGAPPPAGGASAVPEILPRHGPPPELPHRRGREGIPRKGFSCGR